MVLDSYRTLAPNCGSNNYHHHHHPNHHQTSTPTQMNQHCSTYEQYSMYNNNNNISNANQFITNSYSMMPSSYNQYSTSQSNRQSTITVNTSSVSSNIDNNNQSSSLVKNLGTSGDSSTGGSIASLNSEYYDSKVSNNGTIITGDGIQSKKRRKPAPTIATGRRNLKDETVSTEEAERRDKRRERNRKSAQRCRERKIEKKEALQREISHITQSCQAYIDVADRIITAWKQRILLLEERLPGHKYEATQLSISDFESIINNCRQTIQANANANSANTNSNTSIHSGESSTHDNNSMEPSPDTTTYTQMRQVTTTTTNPPNIQPSQQHPSPHLPTSVVTSIPQQTTYPSYHPHQHAPQHHHMTQQHHPHITSMYASPQNTMNNHYYVSDNNMGYM